MDHCATCGHELGGRFCTNCGRPAGDWRTDTAERPSVPAAPVTDAPPPAWTPPPPARYPLYADEAAPPAPGGNQQTEIIAPVLPPETADSADTPDATGRRRRPWGLWAAAAVVLALVAVGGVVLLTGDDDPAGTAGDAPSAEAAEGKQGGGVANLAADATATVPATAAPGADVNGAPVTFEAENMLDGVPETAWRMPGDATGEEIVVTLARESRLRAVGLINGYAKKAAGRDWYHGNRRIEQVQWAFDDGTTVDQDLTDTTGVQSIDVDVTTTTVTLRFVKVSAPGQGRDSRDNTAISDLSLVGGD